MRNLKRALSLTLASVMLLGMMVFGTSAASFTDADQITNVMEATVLQELNVMQGSGGKFSPNQIVTRGQMAILICKILYGDKVNVSQFAGTSEFTDVPANAYYTGYVNMASSLGIINGYGNGKFGPGSPVTTAQAALMLTKALGYYQGGELEGQNWSQNALTAITKATQLNMFGDMKLSVNDGLSRDNVAKMVFNTMTKAVPVEYNKTFNTYYNAGRSWVWGVDNTTYADTLGNKNFDLVHNKNVDDFGRPGEIWGIGTIKYDDGGNVVDVIMDKEIVHDTNEPIAVYTKDMSSTSKTATVERDLRGYSFNFTGTRNTNDNRFQLTVKGTNSAGNTSAVTEPSGVTAATIAGYTADGVVVEVYAGAGDTTSAKIITDVIVYRPEKAKVVAVNANKKTVTLAADYTSGSITISDKDDFYDVVKGLKVNDIVVLVAEDKDNVIDLYIPKTVTGKVTQVKVNSSADKSAIVDGNKYTVSSQCKVANNFNGTLGKEATIYLDKNGYAMYVDAETASVPNYLYLTNLWVGKDVEHGINKDTTYARGVTAEGEIVTLKVANEWAATAKTSGDVKSDDFGTLAYGDGDTVGTAYGPTGTKAPDGNIPYLYGTTNSYGLVVEYKQSSVDPDLYVLVVPADGETDGTVADGVSADSNAVLNTAKKVDDAYFSTGVKFVFVNYTRSNDKLTASAVNGVQAVPSGTNQTHIIYTNPNTNEQLIVATFVEQDYVNDQEVYYVKSNSTYKAQYQVDGKTKTGYKADIWMNGEKLADDAITLTSNVSGGFYLKNGMDGEGTKFTSRNDPYTTFERSIMKVYNNLLTTADGASYQLDANTKYVDVTEENEDVETLDGIKAKLDGGYDVVVSVQYRNVGTDQFATYVYVTDVDEGAIVGGEIAANTGDPEVVETNVSVEKDAAGKAKTVIEGQTTSGVPTTSATLFSNYANPAKKYAVASIDLPAGDYGIRQTSELLKDAHWSSDTRIDTTTGVKTAFYHLTAADTLEFLVEQGKTVTLEFDWSYTSTTPKADFDADYILTVDATNLVCGAKVTDGTPINSANTEASTQGFAMGNTAVDAGTVGSEVIKATGTVKSGTSGAMATSFANITGVPDTVKYTVVRVVLPSAAHTFKTTNPMYAYSNVTGEKTNGYKIQAMAQDAGGNAVDVIIAEGSTVTIEIDWTANATADNFSADYTITVDASGLTCQ